MRTRARSVFQAARPWVVVSTMAAVALVEAAGKRWF
jgi:hypothetical protein